MTKETKDLDIRDLQDELDSSGSSSKKIFQIVFVIIFIAAIAGFAWSFKNYTTIKKQLTTFNAIQNSEKLSEKEIQNIIDQVNEHILLPDNEEPIIATVNNIDKLRETEPEFYKDSKNGDYVLIYEINQKAYIYSPIDDRIVNVGPVVIDDTLKNTEEPEEGKDTEEEMINVEEK